MQELMQCGDLPPQAGSYTASYTMQELDQGPWRPPSSSWFTTPCPRYRSCKNSGWRPSIPPEAGPGMSCSVADNTKLEENHCFVVNYKIHKHDMAISFCTYKKS